ncbi:hypothetical protein NFJ02_33g84710 [Pycnococcus provasolii]
MYVCAVSTALQRALLHVQMWDGENNLTHIHILLPVQDRACLDLAHALVTPPPPPPPPPTQDGDAPPDAQAQQHQLENLAIDLDGARQLCACVEDGNVVTPVERRTLRYIARRFKCTKRAAQALEQYAYVCEAGCTASALWVWRGVAAIAIVVALTATASATFASTKACVLGAQAQNQALRRLECANDEACELRAASLAAYDAAADDDEGEDEEYVPSPPEPPSKPPAHSQQAEDGERRLREIESRIAAKRAELRKLEQASPPPSAAHSQQAEDGERRLREIESHIAAKRAELRKLEQASPPPSAAHSQQAEDGERRLREIESRIAAKRAELRKLEQTGNTVAKLLAALEKPSTTTPSPPLPPPPSSSSSSSPSPASSPRSPDVVFSKSLREVDLETLSRGLTACALVLLVSLLVGWRLRSLIQ